ncbi:MAG: hypothetical protein KGQ59_10400 [Bdellovibrionales bacterium]|nr:hypothetical protein [Bdellovibrionales bacterium]
MTGLLLTLGILVAFLIVPCILLVVPSLAIVSCATSKTLETRAKIAWMCFIVLVWPIGGAIFLSLKSAGVWLRAVGCLSFIIVIVGSGSGLWLEQKRTEQVLMNLQHIRIQEIRFNLSEGQQIRASMRLIESITELKNEIQNLPWYQLERKQTSIELASLLSEFLKDKELTDTEFEDWISKFNSRALLKPKDLREYQRSLGRN